MSVGSLKERISVEKPVYIDDGHGGKNLIHWEKVCDVWADIHPISGREYYEAQQIRNDVTHKVQIRRNTEINEEMRFDWNNRKLKIQSIIDVDYPRFLEVMCVEQK